MSEATSKLPFSFRLEDIVDFLMPFSMFHLVKEISQLVSSSDAGLGFILFDLHHYREGPFSSSSDTNVPVTLVYEIFLSVLRDDRPPMVPRIKNL